MPTSGVGWPRSASATPKTAASAVSRAVAASVRPIAAGMPGRSIIEDVTTNSAASIAMPSSLAAPDAAWGEAKSQDAPAQAT